MTSTARTAPHLRRQKLLISCASLALVAVALVNSKARAQVANATGAFQGNISTFTGSVNRDLTSNTTETITIGTPTATINWSPNADRSTDPFDFLPAGNTATFTSTQGLTDYTVLNRIVPSDPSRSILLNGTVISTLEGTSATGGNIWFYSPGGIVVGATAVFDVGGLLLTSIDLPNGFTADSNGFSGTFAPTEETAPGAIQIQKGARINARDTYVALVAPRIEQGGTVQVDGSAAYVAGDQVTMTFNQGLFDIAVDVGTDDPNGIVHTGTTGGSSNVAAADNHNIYMAAVPKNQALTMLLGGSIGYDDAVTAGVENGKIILSAGRDISASGFGASDGLSASISIGSGNFTSSVEGIADSDLFALADISNLSFAGDVSLTGARVQLGAQNGNQLTVGGNASLGAWNLDGSGGDAQVFASGADSTVAIAGDATLDVTGYGSGGATGVGGTATVLADGGDVTIGGLTSLIADAGSGRPVEVDSGDAIGGSANIRAANGGTVSLADTSLSAIGTGDDNFGNGDGTAGDGTGGKINIFAGTGGSITIDGNLTGKADGRGGNMLDGSIAGGAGDGGDVFVGVDDGDVHVTGGATLTAAGFGGGYAGEATTPAAAQGGAGNGGFVTISSEGPGSIRFDDVVSLDAGGTGGDGQTGGDGRAGNAGVQAVDGTIDLGLNIGISAIGTGGNATVGFGGFGGFGQGGTAYIEALANVGDVEIPATHGTITGGSANLDVSGFGGMGGAGNGDNILPGSGGNGQGGFHQGEEGTGGAFAAAAEPGGSLTLGDTTLVSNGRGGAGGAGGTDQAGGFGGDGSGGSTQAGNYDPDGTGEVSAAATYGNLTLIADGTGGIGGVGGENGVQGDGGSGFGGGAFVNAKGTVSAATIFMSAQGFGGAGTNGGFGQGGIGILQSFAGSSFDIGSDAQMDVSGWGGEGSGGMGGAGTGGNAGEGGATGGVSALDDSTIDVGGALSVTADGHGAGGSTGGEGTGGAAYLEAIADGAVTAGAIVLSAQATGGDGVAVGGEGIGGGAQIIIDGGSVDATGSTDFFQNDELVASGSILMFSDATGGAGAQAGAGTGGLSEIFMTGNGGSLTAANATFLFARGLGGDGDDDAEGDGGTGGDGDGGTARIQVSQLSTDTNATVSLADLTLNAGGAGGAGGSGGGLTGIGGTGGDGGGGTAELDIAGGTFEAGAIEELALGSGGGGGSSANSTGGAIGFGSGGSISTIATGASIGADSLSADASGDVVGGEILLTSRTSGPQAGSLQFGSLQAFADGGSQGGQVQLVADAGTTSNVGDAQLGASGTEGSVSVSAGAPEAGAGTLLADNLTLTGEEIGLSTFSGGDISVSGTLQADAADFVTFTDDGNAGLVSADILNANAFGIAFDGASLGTNIDGTTSVDFETTGDLDVGDGFVTGSLTLHSDTALTTGNLTSGGDMTMSGSSIGAGTLDSGGNMTLDSGAALAALDLTAAGTADLNSTGDMQFGNVDADTLTFSSGGTVNGGNITTDTRAAGASTGAMKLGDITVGPNVPANGDFSVDFTSDTSIEVGNVSGADKVGFATPGTFTAGDISGGSLILALVTGDIHTGSLTTDSDGQVYLADYSMFTDAGGPDDFDETSVLAAAPVPTEGSITIDGPVSTGTFRAAAGTDFSSAGVVATGNVTASAGGILSMESADIGGDLSLTAGDNIDSGDLTADGSIALSAGTDLGTGKLSAGASLSLTTGGDLNTGALESAENLSLTAGGTLTTLDLTAPGEIDLNSTGDMKFGNVDADTLVVSGGGAVNGGNIIVDTRAAADSQGAMTLGDITVEPNVPENGDFSVSLSSGTSIEVGNVSGADKVGFAAPGTLTAGDISGGSLILALVTGDIHVGALTTNADGQVYLADYSMFTGAGGPENFDETPVLAAAPVPTEGSITIDGPVSTGTFRAAAGTDFDSAGILATGDVTASAGGILSMESADIGGDLSLTAGDNIDSGDLSADGSIALSAGTELGTGKLSAGASLSLTTGGDLNTGALDSAENLSLTAGGTLTTLDLTAAGTIDLNSTGDMQFGNIDADTLTFSSGGAVNGGNIVADTHAAGDATGAMKLGDITVGPNVPENGDFSVDFTSDTSIEVGNVSGADKVGFATPGTFTAGDISGGSLILALVTGDIHTGSLTTDSDGQVYLADYSMFTDAGGPDDFDETSVLASDPIATAGSITIDDIVSTGAFRAAAGTNFGSAAIQADQAISISAGGNLSLGNSNAGGDFALTAGGGIDGGDLGADGLLSLSAGTDINAGNLSSGGNLELDAGGNATTLDLTSEEAVAASATGDLNVGKVISGFTPGISDAAVEPTGQDVRLEAENGTLTTGAVQSAGAIFLDAGTDVVATDLTATDAAHVTAGGNSSVNDVNASDATFDAGGTANFFGTVAVPTIGVTSSDINIADGASLGVSGLTTLITLNAVSNNPVILGGPEDASAPGQYTLSEAGDINADSVVLTAIGKTEGVDPDVVIQDAQVEGSQTEDGGVGSMEVDTGGWIRVEGFVDYINAAASDTLTLNGGSGIQVATGTGGISIIDSAGNLSGTLDLIAPDVWVADQSVLDRLAEDPNYANRDSDLATNPGADNQDGNLRAGAIHGEVSGTFLVQNSGTADNPAGVSVGEGGLSIVNSGESPALAIVNGHQVGPDGQIVGGNDFLPTVAFGGDAGFLEASTVNGCPIGTGCLLPPPPPPPPSPPPLQFGAESILGPIGLMTNAEDQGDNGGNGDDGEGDSNSNDELDILLFGLDSGPNAFDPLVDDPVTSGSDAITSGGPQ